MIHGFIKQSFPASIADELLAYSGKHDLFLRLFLNSDQQVDHSILPRYWVITAEEKRLAFQLGASIGKGFRGLALSGKGLSIRVANESIAEGRKLVMQSDIRFCEDNIRVVCKKAFAAQGFPFNISHQCVIQATLKAVGAPPVPLRSYRVGGMVTWVLAFDKDPSKAVFVVKIDDGSHEVILTPQEATKQPKVFKKPNLKAQPAIRNGPRSDVPIATQISSEDRRVNALEDRVAKLETQQRQLTAKVDNGFNAVSAQLQQVLAAVGATVGGPPKTNKATEGTGDTPPPKHQRHS